MKQLTSLFYSGGVCQSCKNMKLKNTGDYSVKLVAECYIPGTPLPVASSINLGMLFF